MNVTETLAATAEIADPPESGDDARRYRDAVHALAALAEGSDPDVCPLARHRTGRCPECGHLWLARRLIWLARRRFVMPRVAAPGHRPGGVKFCGWIVAPLTAADIAVRYVRHITRPRGRL